MPRFSGSSTALPHGRCKAKRYCVEHRQDRRVSTCKTKGLRTNIDELAKTLGLPDWNEIDDYNLNYYCESASTVEGEEEQTEAEDAARDEVFGQWHSGVLNAAKHVFGEHGLVLAPRGKRERPYEFEIVPAVSWFDTIEKITDTINGVGYFHFSSVEELLRSGPYTAREAVEGHLHWLKKRSEVYGDTSAQSIYERSFR